MRHGVVETLPIKNLSLPKLEKRLPKFLTVQQMKDLLEAPVKLLESRKHREGPGRPVSATACLRDVAVLETIYSCGLRISELCGLRAEDIDWSERLVRVRGKGKKERLVPIGEPAWKAIQNYWGVLKHPPVRPVIGFFRGDQEGRAAQAAATFAPPETIPGHRRTRPGPDAAQAAAQLRHASAGRGRGFAERAGVARPRPPGHHADLHARHHRTLEKSLRRGASTGVSGSVSD